MKLLKRLMSFSLALLAATGMIFLNPSNANANTEREITILFDAPGIIQESGSGGSVASPRRVANQSKHIFMCTNAENIPAGYSNCNAELTIDACFKDDVEFHWATMSPGAPYSVVMNKFYIHQTNPPNVLKDKGYTTEYASTTNYSKVPDEGHLINPNDVTFSYTQEPLWQFQDVYPPGGLTVVYNGTFTLFKNGQFQGTYIWDPFVKLLGNC